MIMDLLETSDAFHAAMAETLDAGPPLQMAHPRFATCAASALLAVEHGTTARICFAAGYPQSAAGIIRLQYEATVRAAWLLHAASVDEIALVGGPLGEEADRSARKLPGANAMLKVLAEEAPPGLLVPLQQFHDVSWHGLNSYVHAGIHPLRRLSEGFPLKLACELIRNSNGMLHVAFRLLAVLTGSQPTMDTVTRSWKAHEACLPPR